MRINFFKKTFFARLLKLPFLIFLFLIFAHGTEASAQYFDLRGRIVHMDTGMCVGVSGETPNNGSYVILEECQVNRPNQRWKFSGFSLVNASGFCLHAEHDQVAEWTPLVVGICNLRRTAGWNWNPTGSSFSARWQNIRSGLCASPGTSSLPRQAGAVLKLHNCSTSHQWSKVGNLTKIVSGLTGHCLTTTNSAGQLIVKQNKCDASSSEQVWFVKDSAGNAATSAKNVQFVSLGDNYPTCLHEYLRNDISARGDVRVAGCSTGDFTQIWEYNARNHTLSIYKYGENNCIVVDTWVEVYETAVPVIDGCPNRLTGKWFLTDPRLNSFDKVYFMQPDNSYKRETGINTLTSWLDKGFRALELDVIDKGNWQNEEGPPVADGLSAYNNNCSEIDDDKLGDCLNDIEDWMDKNPHQGPIVVYISMDASSNPAAAWDSNEVKLLDEWINTSLGDRLYGAQELYRYVLGATNRPTNQNYLTIRYSGHLDIGQSGYTGPVPIPSLRQGVYEAGWPSMHDLKDKILVFFTGGKSGSVNQNMSAAILKRFMHTTTLPNAFYCPDVETDTEELSPGKQADGMMVITSGAVVCSNLKARKHYQVTANAAAALNQMIHLHNKINSSLPNKEYTHNYIAVAHGISSIARNGTNPTDFTDFGGAFPYVGIRQIVPGYFKMKPALGTGRRCMTTLGDGKTDNEELIVLECVIGRDKTKFVYTAEGQLRPESYNPLCVDIVNGRPSKGANAHLFNCDGGSSEKWFVNPYDGGKLRFSNAAKHREFCLEMNGLQVSNNANFMMWTCSNRPQQQFTLEAVPKWAQTIF